MYPFAESEFGSNQSGSRNVLVFLHYQFLSTLLFATRRSTAAPPPPLLSNAICLLHPISSLKRTNAGLPLTTSEGRLMKVFSEFGEVTLVQLPIDKESGQSLGFAYIWYVKEESAQLAVQEMNGKFFDGRFIYVTIAKPGSTKSSKRTTAYKF